MYKYINTQSMRMGCLKIPVILSRTVVSYCRQKNIIAWINPSKPKMPLDIIQKGKGKEKGETN